MPKIAYQSQRSFNNHRSSHQIEMDTTIKAKANKQNPIFLIENKNGPNLKP